MRQTMRISAVTWAPALLAAAALAGCDADHVSQRESLTETRQLDPAGAFTLENTNGEVVVDTWKEASVRIGAEKSGSPWAVEKTKIEIRVEGDRLSVKTRQHGGWFFLGGGKVDYRVTVPERARLDVKTANGRVRIEGATGTVRASTTNGSVEVEDAAGAVEASTANGSVRAAFHAAPAEGTIRLSTTNGTVTLLLPPDATGEFEASTVNGDIHSDFPLDVRGGISGHRLSGRLGEGRARFEMRTVNGGVGIRKR
jgi:putative adhesin